MQNIHKERPLRKDKAQHGPTIVNNPREDDHGQRVKNKIDDEPDMIRFHMNAIGCY